MPAKKRLGQHFLFDPSILSRIADALAVKEGETVLEIGPGRGTLTRQLLERTPRLVVIEKDRDLLPILAREVPGARVVEGDALDLDWHAVAPAPFVVAGNIPYNITSPLIEKALTPPRPRVIVFLVQKEVADRITASPGNRAYGALSVGVQAQARAERLFTVPAGAFRPPPRVDSALLRLTPLARPLIEERDAPGFRRLVVGLFGFRRKQLIRGLRELTGLSAALVAERLDAAGIAGEARPEALSPPEFVRLFQAFPIAGGQASA